MKPAIVKKLIDNNGIDKLIKIIVEDMGPIFNLNNDDHEIIINFNYTDEIMTIENNVIFEYIPKDKKKNVGSLDSYERYDGKVLLNIDMNKIICMTFMKD